MKKYIILCAVVVLLVISFGYMNSYMKDESTESEEIEVEIGKMNVYKTDISSLGEYCGVLGENAIVYVKGRVKSIDKSYEVFDVVEISDDLNGDIITVRKLSYPVVDVGDTVYVFGQIKYYYEDDNGCHYYIDATDEYEVIYGSKSYEVNPYITSVKIDDTEYMSVSEAEEKANMIYEETLFELEGTLDISNNEYDYKYRLSDGESRIKLKMDDNLADDLNLVNGESVVIIVKESGEEYLRVQEIRRK